MRFDKDFINSKKKIIIIVAIVVLVAVIILISLLGSSNKEKKKEFSPKSFTTTDSAITLTVPGNFEFEEQKDDSFILSIKSSNTSSGIYISKVEIQSIRDLSKYLETDKKNFVSSFQNTSNVSDITETSIKDLRTYNYHFNYDSNYVDVYWIFKNSTFYVLDFDSHQSGNNLSDHISEIIDSLNFNEE